jgi:choline kinase
MVKTLEVVVIAGGEGSRFESDFPKHLVEIAGEPLLLGIAKKLTEYAVDIKIIIPPENELYKQVLGNQFLLFLRQEGIKFNTSKHVEAIKVSSVEQNLLIVYGDTYFSKQALDTIFQQVSFTNESIIFFCRHNGYTFVNKGGGEIFAVYIDKNSKNHFLEAAYKTQELYESKKIWRDGTWEIAKTLKNHTIENEFRDHPNFDFYYEIDDSTDDIDFIEEYHNLKTLLPNSLNESILLLEKIYESLNNIAQKNKISIDSYFDEFSEKYSNSMQLKLRLGEIIELEFDKLKAENIALLNQILDVYQSKSFRYTSIFRKLYFHLKKQERD